MKFVSLAISIALVGQQATAFPAAVSEELIRRFQDTKSRSVEERAAAAGCPHAKRQLPGVVPPFDAKLQYVSNKGAHGFVPPSSTDQRGPCPGLNAMANHGYLPHNGIGTIDQFISGTMAAFGMGADLATFLSVYGAIFDGDLTSFSIGGPSPSLLNSIGLLGVPQGLSGSHNKYESDVSPTRGDLYQYGNDYLLQMKQFKALYQLGQQNGNSYDLNVLTTFRATRFQESISQNPYFFNGPFSGVIVQPAAYTFIYRFMANKSSEHPQGVLNGDILKSFFSITGDYPNFKYTPGYEKFPDNWYKRNPVDYYTIPYFALDLVSAAVSHPEFLSIGGNTGKVNTFTGVNPTDLTGGVFNSASLLQGNNAICFGLQLTLQGSPDILSGLYSDTNAAQDAIGTAINKATNALGCPQLNAINKNQFNQAFAPFPGFTKLKSNGQY